FFDLSNAEPSEAANAARRELSETAPDTSGSITVSLDALREKDYSLLPTAFLPPRNVRESLMGREQAESQITSSLVELERETSGLRRALRAFEDLRDR